MKITTSYDHEGCFAVLVDSGSQIASYYEFRKHHETWEDCRDTAIEGVRAKHEASLQFGEPPAPETFPLDPAGGLHAV